MWQLQAWSASAEDSPPGDDDDGGINSSGGDGGKIPAAVRTVNVSNSSQLSSALSSAQPGDHIVLADGTYGGFSVSRNGASGRPIVIRAANVLGARITGNVNLSGDFVWLIGIESTGSQYAVSITGSDNRVSRSRFRTTGTSVRTTGTALRATIDHNDFDSQSKATSVGWMGVVTSASRDGHNHRIFRNYFHDSAEITSGDDNSAIMAGGTLRTGQSKYQSGNIFEYNLFHNWHGDGEVISNKGGGNTYQFNTVTNSNEFVNRHGTNNKYIANWFENAQGIRIHDKGHVLIGNRGNIRVFSGDLTSADFHAQYLTASGYAASEDVVLAGNIGSLRLGAWWSGPLPPIPMRSTRVEAHEGSVSRGHEQGTVISQTTSRSIPEAFKLSPSQVGPNAPTAPKL
jgi:hypothetical protein